MAAQAVKGEGRADIRGLLVATAAEVVTCPPVTTADPGDASRNSKGQLWALSPRGPTPLVTPRIGGAPPQDPWRGQTKGRAAPGMLW